MNENIDLTKILKDCPEGTKFYHAGYGNVLFCGIDLKNKYPIRLSFCNDGFYNTGVTPKGTISRWHNGECLLFPSKDQRDWSKFTAPWYKKEKFDPTTLNPFDKVLVRDTHSKPWRCSLFSHIETDRHLFPYATSGGNYSFCIPFNDDTKHLVGTKDEAPEYYRYLED